MSQSQTPGDLVPSVTDRRISDAPAVLIRSMAGQITLWSPAMQERYGFASGDAVGRISQQLLGTLFWQSFDAIQATLLKEKSWSGGLLHRHADGRLMPTSQHWYLTDNADPQEAFVTELHSDILLAGTPVAGHLADVMSAIGHELSQPLAAASTYIHVANQEPSLSASNRPGAREAVAAAAGQFDRIKAGIRLFRELSEVLRGDC